jgi:lipopolysaccharide/colanic/teichoic acid biosynthesis glycosyltransferase
MVRGFGRTDSIMKRLLDLTGAVVGLALLWPLFLVIGIVVKAYDGGPIFYRARRVGKHGQLFHVYKFRTMTIDADEHGAAITARGDSRVTRPGRLLRRTKLDELPQLLNVLLGEMSLVGPRPEDPRYVLLYTPEQQQVLSVLPGITSAASLAYRNEEQLLDGPDWEAVYRTSVLPAKLAIDLEYLTHRTTLTDIALLIRTVIAVVR